MPILWLGEPLKRVVQGIPLGEAVLCLNCETIYSFSQTEICPYCASPQLLSVALQFGGSAVQKDFAVVEHVKLKRSRRAKSTLALVGKGGK